MSHASIIVALDFGKDKHISDVGIDQINEAVAFQMLPFDENGEMFRDGTRWDWYQIGGRYSGKFLGRDIIQRRDLSDEVIEEFKIKQAQNTWTEYHKEIYKNPKRADDKFFKSYVYGLDENETIDTLVEKYKKNKISAFAFLRNRRWHENGRLGWFGTTTKTECEINHGHEGTCLHRNEELDAQIVSFNHDEKGWTERYYDRFIKNLEPHLILVNVDYHV